MTLTLGLYDGCICSMMLVQPKMRSRNVRSPSAVGFQRSQCYSGGSYVNRVFLGLAPQNITWCVPSLSLLPGEGLCQKAGTGMGTGHIVSNRGMSQSPY